MQVTPLQTPIALDLAVLQFVMKHAPGARALRFVRKLTPLKGLSDNVLLNVAARMKEETYEVRSWRVCMTVLACMHAHILVASVHHDL